MKRPRSPGELVARLTALPVRIESMRVCQDAVALDDYPGVPRPTSTVCLSGNGESGFGENVAFTEQEHEEFVGRAANLLEAGGDAVPRRVGEVIRPGATPHQRAALEAAVVDLAMRQAGISLAELTDRASAELRFVVSFAASADPCRELQRRRAGGWRGQFKVDVDPTWDEDTRRELARERAGIAILDFKGRGDAALANDLSSLFPEAIFEDPPAGTTHRHISRDASLGDSAAVAAALSHHHAVNLKAPRMGGPLELLRALDLVMRSRDNSGIAAAAGAGAGAAAAAPAPVAARAGESGDAYFGGMFEVGVGRSQARQLAALFCGACPNDLATNVRAGSAGVGPQASPVTVPLDRPGFGVVD